MNLKIRYCIHKNPSLFSVLSQINPVHMTLSHLRSISLKVVQIMELHLGAILIDVCNYLRKLISPNKNFFYLSSGYTIR
jgi:hypothetical protein